MDRSLGSMPPHLPWTIDRGALKGPLSQGHFTARVPESITAVYKEGDEKRINHPVPDLSLKGGLHIPSRF
ncbi:hypothetical protein TNCV_1666051 [Trichonephila clavipes]|nr:hypothetical protein TNCV_1666051 [Trichonephila clavipes]